MHFRLSSGMARRVLLLLLLRYATPGSAENSSIPAVPRNYTSGGLPDTGSAMLRLFYVVTGLCGLISVYFLIRAFRCVSASNQRLVSRGRWAEEHVIRALDELLFLTDCVSKADSGRQRPQCGHLPTSASGALLTGVQKTALDCKTCRHSFLG